MILNNLTYKLKKSVQLTYSISQKDITILNYINKLFENNYIIIKDNMGINRLKITGKINLIKLITYFDNYNLQSEKYLQYIILRKVHFMLERKEHLNEKGLLKIFNKQQTLRSIYKTPR
jgi:hypothetical protein